jgi:3,4-dehydroadipyl-CoA semialdehyde dehydrogenase
MSQLLSNFLAGRAISGSGVATPLFDPVLGTELVRVDASGLDLSGGFAQVREQAGAALRALTYVERAGLLARIAELLQSRRDAYYEIATANSGTVKNDSAVDIDGAIYTLSTYARLGAKLPEALSVAEGGRLLLDGASTRLSKDPVFASQHLLVPTRGLALFINAFNFPSWGLWEKAAPALLSGVPVVVKPATSTAWLTQAMVADVIEAGLLPPGAINVICGSPAGLLDALTPFDVLSFTGSADTAATLRSHAAVARRSVRINVEADSVNSALLLPGQAAGSPAFDLLVKEVAREMTVKSGQKCTAIRRVFVPEALYDEVAQAVGARLAKVRIGNPRNDQVSMGSLVSRGQFNAVRAGLDELLAHAQVLHDGRSAALLDADPAVAACHAPVLLGTRDADGAALVHTTEVFGPVATLLPYRDLAHATALAARGEGSLVCSLFGDDDSAATLAATAAELAASHGRVHVVTPAVAKVQTGHGNVMPQSLHGGPGRAGGGEELGGLKALNFYHRRTAVQAAAAVLQALGASV